MENNKQEESKEKRKVIILAIITVVIFIATSVATTYAFYSATIRGNAENGSVTIQTANIYSVFNMTNYINDEDILPGYSNTLEFSIVNVSNTENAFGSYNIVWEIDENELDDESFVYALIGETIVNDEVVDSSSISHNSVVSISETRVPNRSTVLGSGLINTGVTHRYRLVLNFKETGTNQNEFQGKELRSYISVRGN